MKFWKTALIQIAIVFFVLLQFFSVAQAKEATTVKHFVLQDIRGSFFNSRTVVGKKPFLIIFSTTWCPTCNSYLPEYKRLHAKYSKVGVEVIGINLSESKPQVVEWVIKNHVYHRILLDEDGKVGKDYGVLGFPTLTLIDKTGKIVCHPCSSIELVEKMIQKMK